MDFHAHMLKHGTSATVPIETLSILHQPMVLTDKDIIPIDCRENDSEVPSPRTMNDLNDLPKR